MEPHHVLFERLEWSKRYEAKRLRNNHLLIPPIDGDVHCELHKDCPPVPLLGSMAIMMVSDHFEPGHDHMSSINNLLHAIDSIEHSKLHPVTKQLAQLALFAVELQLPYIREGLHV